MPVCLTNFIAVGAGYSHFLAVAGDTAVFRSGTLQNPRVAHDAFHADLPTDRGRTYVVEYKNSLADPSWSLVRLIAGDGSVQTLVQPNETTSQRFYRARRMP